MRQEADLIKLLTQPQGSVPKSKTWLQTFFPFKEYFADAGDLFLGESFEADMEKAWGCFRHLKIIFQELEECRAFELLKVLFLVPGAHPIKIKKPAAL